MLAAPFLGALLLLAPPARAQRATLERLVQQQTLPNGLLVVVMENHAVPLATAEVVVRAGAITQEPEDQGVPHLFEHMLFKSYGSAHEMRFGQAAGRLQARYNGTTDDEAVTYYLTTPSEHTGEAIGLLADLVRDPHFEDEDLRSERQVVFGEFGRDVSDPRAQLDREVSRRLWGDSYYRKNTLGEVRTLEAAETPKLRAIYRRLYVPNNAALVVTGDVTAAQVFEAARRRFGGWKAGGDPGAGHPAPVIAPLDSVRAVVVHGDVHDVTIVMRWQGPSVRGDAASTYAADVLSDVVDDEESGFHDRLVDSGLFSSADLSYSTLDHVGPITLTATTTTAKLSGALTALAREVQLMADTDYVSPAQLAAAKQRRLVRSAFALEAGPSLAHTAGFWWAVSGLDYYLGYADGLAAQTPADLTRYVTRYIAGKPFVVGALTPTADANQTMAWLRDFADMTLHP